MLPNDEGKRHLTAISCGLSASQQYIWDNARENCWQILIFSPYAVYNSFLETRKQNLSLFPNLSISLWQTSTAFFFLSGFFLTFRVVVCFCIFNWAQANSLFVFLLICQKYHQLCPLHLSGNRVSQLISIKRIFQEDFIFLSFSPSLTLFKSI